MVNPQLPIWLRKKSESAFRTTHQMKALIKEYKLHSVCQEAKCPNIGACFAQRTATFMIMGDRCTRRCLFCNISKLPPKELDDDEPYRLARICKKLALEYVVITSVTRDDLPDGGALHFFKTVRAIKEAMQNILIELLIPDFNGDDEALSIVITSEPELIGHNIETVSSLNNMIRPGADYKRSLKILKTIKIKNKDIITKSGFMVGLGEKEEEAKKTLIDLKEVGCDIVVIGQYLQPSKHCAKVARFYHPEEFEKLAEFAKGLGFKAVLAEPMARSSYQAEKLYHSIKWGD